MLYQPKIFIIYHVRDFYICNYEGVASMCLWCLVTLKTDR